MKTSLTYFLVVVHLVEARAEVTLEQLEENRSLELSCSPQQHLGSLTGLHLYHRGPRAQTTLLSMTHGGGLKVDVFNRWRLRLSGGLDSPQVNVTLSHLRRSDTGLYVWELTYGGNGSDPLSLSTQQLVLLVDGAGAERPCQCSPSYPPLLLTIFTATGLLVLVLTWLATDRRVKLRCHRRPPRRPAPPIYEEMARKQQSSGTPDREAPPHPEEANFPLYANPNVKQSQENYYACPRQLALRAGCHTCTTCTGQEV